MKLLLTLFIAIAALATQSEVHAAGSMLRVACDGDDIGAETSINGVFKGECPLDIQVNPGTVRLKLVKKAGRTRERTFEQQFLMGDGAVKKVEARLGPETLTAEGERIEADQQRQAAKKMQEEQEQARLREENRQREMALAEQRRKERQARVLEEFKAEGIEAGTGKSFRDCADCPEMLWIPPGQLPQRIPPANSLIGWLNQVRIGYPLAVGKFEVTFDEWDACVADRACVKKAEGGKEGLCCFAGMKVTPDKFWGRGRQPVINVSWSEAAAYLDWLSKKTGQSYRLLSVAEFTYMARGGMTTNLPWGDEIGSGNANCKNCGSKWDDKQPAPVGSFKPNGWGIHDVIGNVGEMVSDCARESTNFDAAPKDGGPILTDCLVTTPAQSRTTYGDRFVVMGGSSFVDIAAGVPRDSAYEKYPGPNVGFRVARTYQGKALDGNKGK